jgi:hypothetical protein
MPIDSLSTWFSIAATPPATKTCLKTYIQSATLPTAPNHRCAVGACPPRQLGPAQWEPARQDSWALSLLILPDQHKKRPTFLEDRRKGGGDWVAHKAYSNLDHSHGAPMPPAPAKVFPRGLRRMDLAFSPGSAAEGSRPDLTKFYRSPRGGRAGAPPVPPRPSRYLIASCA